MEPLIEGVVSNNGNILKIFEKFNVPEDVRKEILQSSKNDRIFKNDIYTVTLTTISDGQGYHLSIRRNDREAIHDWRDFQEIKNQILGEEVEAVELYPAESRLVDGANQYHLWAYSEKGFRFPFGFNERKVIDGTGELDPETNTKQRPFKK